jgi:hypothetical protein
MQQVIAIESTGCGERVDEHERRPRAVHHGDRRGPVQGHDRGGVQALKQIVEVQDLRPIRIFSPHRLTM